MQISIYQPSKAHQLSEFARKVAADPLYNLEFVNHYYTSSDYCRLYIATEEATICGSFGLELMPFVHDDRRLTIGFGTNFFSALPGVGAFLFLKYRSKCDAGLVFGGSSETHQIISQQQWTYYRGIGLYRLNPVFSTHSTGLARWAKKAIWKPRFGTSLPRRAAQIRNDAGDITVVERNYYDEEILPRNSPFMFRFDPSVDYLAWRYSTSLSYVRYRLFQIFAAGVPVGYVVFNTSNSVITVAQADATSHRNLLYGVLKGAFTLCETSPDVEIRMVASHPTITKLLRHYGFVHQSRWDRQVAIGGRGAASISPDTTQWLFNHDWGDIGLR